MNSPSSADRDWDQALADFRSELVERDRKESGIERYVRGLADEARSGPWDITMQEIEAWTKTKRWSKATTRGTFVSLRAFYAWGVRVGLCDRSPLVGLAIATPRSNPGPEQGAPSPNWIEPMAAHRRHLIARGLLPRTVAQYRILLTAFSHCFASIDAVTTQDVEDYCSRMLRQLSGGQRHPGNGSPSIARPEADALVFTTANGGPMFKGTFARGAWRPAVKAAGLEGLRVHDLRHSFVAILTQAGANPKEVSTWAGHSSVAFTLDRYGHLYDDHGNDVAERIDALLASSRSSTGNVRSIR